jgi:WD40 repeat protein
MPQRRTPFALLLLFLLAATPAANSQRPAAPAADLHGDPLPAGALARLGTTRFRHGGVPTALAFLDARTLLSSGPDGSVRLWDVPSGRLIRTMAASERGSPVLATEGKLIAGVGQEGRFALWDGATGRLLRTFGRVDEGSYAQTLTLKGDLLSAVIRRWVHGRVHRWVLSWELDGKEPRREREYSATDLPAWARSTDGRLVVARGKGTIRLADLLTDEPLGKLEGPRDFRVDTLAFWPGTLGVLASVTRDDGCVRLWDPASGKELYRIPRKEARVLALTADGKTLAIAGRRPVEDTLLWDVAARKEILRLRGGPLHGYGSHLVFSPDGRYLALAGDSESAITVWETASGKILHHEKRPRSEPTHLALAPDGKTGAISCYNGDLHVWELATGKILERLSGGDTYFKVIGFVGNGQLLVAAMENRSTGYVTTLRWHDLAAGKVVKTLRLSERLAYGFALAADNRTMTVANASQTYGLLDLATGKKRHAWQWGQAGWGAGPVFSPDGKQVALDGIVWETGTGKQVRRFSVWKGHSATVNNAAFSPDGKTVASVCSRRVCLWDAGKDGEPRILHTEQSECGGYALAFAPNGKWLAVGGAGWIKLWDLASGKEVHRWDAHRGDVCRLAFTPDGTRLVSTGRDATALVWDMARFSAKR